MRYGMLSEAKSRRACEGNEQSESGRDAGCEPCGCLQSTQAECVKFTTAHRCTTNIAISGNLDFKLFFPNKTPNSNHYAEKKKKVLLVANGDLRLSANQNCWARQEEMEQELTMVLESLGGDLKRAHI